MSPDPSAQLGSFFEEWLPSRFRQLAAEDKSVGQTACTLLVVAGSERFWLSLSAGALKVSRTIGQTPPTFRVHGSEAIFLRLVATALEADPHAPNDRALKLLKLDPETVRLAANIPSCVRLRVTSDEASHELIFGPGTQAETNVGCTAECLAEDLELLRRGNTDPVELFMSGRLKLDGDLQVAMALSSVLL